MRDPVWWFWRWTPAEQVTRECKRRMDVLDQLPAVVRYAIHQARAYTESTDAKRWVKRYGAERGDRDHSEKKEGCMTSAAAMKTLREQGTIAVGAPNPAIDHHCHCGKYDDDGYPKLPACLDGGASPSHWRKRHDNKRKPGENRA